MTTKGMDINNEKSNQAKVFHTYPDGFLVRAMIPEDAKIVQTWYTGMGIICKYDLDIALSVFPHGRGFYIGELDGQVVSSAIRIPWSDNVFYGSLYYVEESHRGRGYGTRLRDQVAFSHVGDSILVVDAVEGKVAETNKKFGYIPSFRTSRYQCIAKESMGIVYDGKIVKVHEISFDDLIQYDNKCFVSKDNPIRRAFMQKLIQIPGGASLVALDSQYNIVGFGTRRPCISKGHHMIGPLYADSANIAEALMQALSSEIAGDNITINIWVKNESAVVLVKKIEMDLVFNLQRMYVNGDPQDYKDTVFGVTSIDVCGF